MSKLRIGDDLADAGYKFSGKYAGVNTSVINSLKSSTLARILSNATQTNPREMARIFGKMDDANLEKIVKNMKSDDYAKMMNSLDAGGSRGRAMATKLRGLNKGDDVGTAYRKGADAAQNPRGADDVRNIDNTAARKEFWSTVRSGGYIGAGAGLLMWIDKKFEDAKVDLDSTRVEQELVLLAQKSDVAEELDRLDSHVSEARNVLKKGGAVGRRLDFMMQEFNREANTLGSKAINTDITAAAVECKVLIEQMREQVQNIE